jgi:hypothetical protein
MRPHPDPLRVYAHAVTEGDERLAAVIAERLFPWVRCDADPGGLPTTAQQTRL